MIQCLYVGVFSYLSSSSLSFMLWVAQKPILNPGPECRHGGVAHGLGQDQERGDGSSDGSDGPAVRGGGGEQPLLHEAVEQVAGAYPRGESDQEEDLLQTTLRL